MSGKLKPLERERTLTGEEHLSLDNRQVEFLIAFADLVYRAGCERYAKEYAEVLS